MVCCVCNDKKTECPGRCIQCRNSCCAAHTVECLECDSVFCCACLPDWLECPVCEQEEYDIVGR